MEITTTSDDQTREIGKVAAQKVKPGDTIALYGDLGSGKTTFVQGLLSGLGITQRVTSPTFVIMKLYSTPTIPVVHLDLYRLEDAAQLKAIGFGDMIDDKRAITIIEWAEKANDFLPQSTRAIHFSRIDDTTRHINADWL